MPSIQALNNNLSNYQDTDWSSGWIFVADVTSLTLMKRDLLSPQPNEVSSPRQRHPVFLTHPPSSQKHKTQSTTAGQSQDRKTKQRKEVKPGCLRTS